MPKYVSSEDVQKKEREDRARAYLAQARLYADGVTQQVHEESGNGHLKVSHAAHLAVMNAVMAVAEMAVPPEPDERPATRPL